MKSREVRDRLRWLLTAFFVLVGVLFSSALSTPPFAQEPPKIGEMKFAPANKESYKQLAQESEAMLRHDVLGVWFPRTVDKIHGGFQSQFSREWKPFGEDSKFSVFQGRMTWIAAQTALREPELKEQFLPIANHGIEYLTDTAWDKQDGGFYWGLDENGKISNYYTDGKHLYGMSFAIYGLAAGFQATRNPTALEYAKRGFYWIEEHAHDKKNGGYFEWLSRDGHPIPANPDSGTVQLLPVAGFPVGYKSMNTHIHLLESFTQLYEVWKDDTLRVRVQELLGIVRDKICVEPGVMNLYFTNSWQAFPDHDSYGHDVEAAYLMLEAEEVLGQGHDPKTERMARMLVDHALHYGWDVENGGFYQEGTTTGKPEEKSKSWWVEFEGLNALLLMHERYGKQTDIYFKAFQRQWDFIKNRQIDHEYGGVYETIGPDGQPVTGPKGSIWKAAYHDGRALLNVTERLKHLAENGN